MVYKGSNAYSTRIDDRQMEWLRKDLAATDPAVRDVVVAMHVPTVNGLQTDGSYKKALENFDDFYALFADYNLTVMSGHWHHAHSVRIGDKAAEYILPAACGTWWYKLLCNDGTPAAFSACTVNGTSMSYRIVPFGDEYAAERYRVYNKGVTTNTGTAAPGTASDPAGGSPAILLNLWEMRPDWTFTCYENGAQTSGRLTRVGPHGRPLAAICPCGPRGKHPHHGNQPERIAAARHRHEDRITRIHTAFTIFYHDEKQKIPALRGRRRMSCGAGPERRTAASPRQTGGHGQRLCRV